MKKIAAILLTIIYLEEVVLDVKQIPNLFFNTIVSGILEVFGHNFIKLWCNL